MKALIMTMVYNESFWLKLWVDYYGRQVGYRNLFVIDHGSDDGSLDALPKKVGRVRLPREAGMNELRRARAVTRMQQSFLQYYDAVIYSDADEFICPDPEKYDGLLDYLKQDNRQNISPLGFNVVQKLSCEEALDDSQKFLAQRRYCSFSPAMCKPIVNKRSVVFGQGFHSSTASPNICSDLFLFHFKDFSNII